MELSIGGVSYAIDTDFRTWIAVSELMREFWTDPGHEVENLKNLYEIETLVFGGRIEQSAEETINAITAFMQGYPEPPTSGYDEPREPIVDFAVDLNAIVVAIRDQSGIDLSYRRTEPFHWWLFLLEFRCLAGVHWITRLMQIRSYEGDDKEQKKLRYRYSLPPRLTPEEREQMDALDSALGD